MSYHSNINELTLKSCRPPPTHKMGNTPTLSFDKPIQILELICILYIMYKTRLSYFSLESIKSYCSSHTSHEYILHDQPLPVQ